eukprot:2618246-Rhodomonas_salina.1
MQWSPNLPECAYNFGHVTWYVLLSEQYDTCSSSTGSTTRLPGTSLVDVNAGTGTNLLVFPGAPG